MKILTALLTSLALFAGAVHAADNDKPVQGENVKINIQLLEGSQQPPKLVQSTQVITESGKVTPFFSGKERTLLGGAVLREGLSVIVTPMIEKDGSISLAYAIDLSAVDSIQTQKSDATGAEVQLPQVTSYQSSATVNVANGQKIKLPFGPATCAPACRTPDIQPMASRYTVVLSASRL